MNKSAKKSKIITTPLTDETIAELRVGDAVLINGSIYTARDAAHKRLVDMLAAGEEMPFDFAGQIVYYAGPTPPRPGAVVGSIGPTTSGRMDAYSLTLMERGLKVMMGKGVRRDPIKQAIVSMNGLFLATVGGAAALISRCVKASELVAFPDLGTEAICRLTVVDFPAIVAVDTLGNDIYAIDIQE